VKKDFAEDSGIQRGISILWTRTKKPLAKESSGKSRKQGTSAPEKKN
jgi:hypothetical protein